MQTIYQKLQEILDKRERAALCTIVSTRGSTPLKAGAKMIVWEDGTIFSTIGGGRLEFAIIDDAKAVIKNCNPKFFIHELKNQHGMCCGGALDVFIEPLMSAKKLFIFGAGHVGKAIVKHTQDLDFEVTVIDSREGIFDDWDFKKYTKVIGPFSEAVTSLPFDPSTLIVIATYDHQTDRDMLSYCLRQEHEYLGMIGSKSKIKQTYELFTSAGIATDEELDNVDMPIGLSIEAETADEIAISIVAKLIQIKNTVS